MNCPTCGTDNVDDTRLYADNSVGSSEDMYIVCNDCGCTFLPDGEIYTKWDTCICCSDYVAPEDKPRHGDPVCQNCSD